MKNVVLLYNTCCIYEISILNYFLSVTGQEVLFVSLDGDEKKQQKVTGSARNLPFHR